MNNMEYKNDPYFKKKIQDIHGYMAIAVGAANMSGVMFGKCTDGVIKARDEMTAKTEKTIIQLLKRYGK